MNQLWQQKVIQDLSKGKAIQKQWVANLVFTAVEKSVKISL